MSRQRIRVAFAINDFIIGGAQRLYLGLFKHLDPALFDIHLITLFQFPDKKELYADVPAHVTLHRLHFSGFKDVASWWRLLSLMRRIQPSVVLSSLFFSNTVIRILSLLGTRRVITVEHNTYVQKTRAQIFVDRLLSHVTSAIVAVSDTVRTFTSEQEGIPLSKFIVIKNGIDVSSIRAAAQRSDTARLRRSLGLRESDKVIINVGRLTAQKNQGALIDAFAQWQKRHPEYRLIILGEGSRRADYESQIARLGAQAHIRLLGAQVDIIPYYALCEFFVSTAHIEGFGIAHAEALACGLPVLTTKTAGPDEMIAESRNGLFLKDGSIGSIVQGLDAMVHADRGTMANHAPASIVAYDIRASAEAYEKLIQRYGRGIS